MPPFRLSTLTPLALAALLAARAESCGTKGYSVHALTSDSTSVFDARLLGVWRDSALAKGDQWLVMRTDSTENGLLLGVTDPTSAGVLSRATPAQLMALDDRDAELERTLRQHPSLRLARRRDSTALAHLLDDRGGPRLFSATLDTVAGQTILDITVFNADSAQRLGQPLLLPAHWFWRAIISENRIELQPLSASWLGDQLKNGTIVLPSTNEGDNLVLTASTRELRSLIARFVADTDAWPRGTAKVLLRVTPDNVKP